MGSRRIAVLRGRRAAVLSGLGGVLATLAIGFSLLSPAQADTLTAIRDSTPAAAPRVVVSVPPTPAATVSAVGRTTMSAVVTAKTAGQYWTAARMASATSEADGKTLAQAAGRPGRTTAAISRATLPSAYSNGRPSIGVVFYASKNAKTHYCTAFVVSSAGKNLIMMAAHCHVGAWMAFVPGYRIHGTTIAPYGIYPVLRGFTDGRFYGGGASATNLDYSFAKVGPDARGRQIERVVAGNTLTITPAYYNASVGVTGYPKASSAPADRPVTCWTHTSKLAGYHQMVFLCRGFYGGTSGSPWLIHLNSRTNTGNVIGLIGGVGGGGPNDWTSYSPIFDANTFTLYHYAVAH